jgi:hypothetical protein
LLLPSLLQVPTASGGHIMKCEFRGLWAATDESLIGGRAHAGDTVEKGGILREKWLHHEPYGYF